MIVYDQLCFAESNFLQSNCVAMRSTVKGKEETMEQSGAEEQGHLSDSTNSNGDTL